MVVDAMYMPYDADFPPIASIDMNPYTFSVDRFMT
jgi:hypothetical protein